MIFTDFRIFGNFLICFRKIDWKATDVTLFWNLARNPEKNSSKIRRKNAKFEVFAIELMNIRLNFPVFWEIQVTTKRQLCFIMNKHILHLQVVIFGVDTARSGAGYLFKDTLKQVQKLMKNMASSSDFVHNRHNQSILVCYLNLSLHYCCSSYQMYFILWLHVTARQTENGLKHYLMNWDTTWMAH